MKVLNLHCDQQHVFEGWFASEDDFRQQQQRGLLSCPVCGSAGVEKGLSAPHVQTGKNRRPSAADGAAAQTSDTPAAPDKNTQPERAERMVMRAMYERMVQHVMAHTVDVGEAFAQQARQMHAGEMAEAPIRGKASPQEAQALREEGIDVVALPVPAASRNPLQ